MPDDLQGWTIEGAPAPVQKTTPAAQNQIEGWTVEAEPRLADRLSPAPAPPPPTEQVSPEPTQSQFVGPIQPPSGAEQTGLPGVPIMGANVQKVPLFDEPKSGPPEINAKTGLPRQEPGYGAVPILDAPIRGTQQIIQGGIGLRDAFHQAQASDVELTGDPKKSQAMREDARRQAAGGLSSVLSGALELYTPALISHLAMAPVETGLHVAGGMAGQQITEKGLESAGVPQEYAALAGDLVLLTGVYGGVQKAKAKVDDVLGKHNRVAEALLEKERSGGQVAELTDAIFHGESYPVKIANNPVTVEYQGASRTNGRGFWRVVDESGKPLHAGTGEDVQAWLRSNGAVSTAPEPPAPTETVSRKPANATQAEALETAKPEPGGTAPAEPRIAKTEKQSAIDATVEEAQQRLQDIRAMQEHLDSGQDVQMGQLTMEHTSPEERRAMLADNVSEHQKLYDELWEQLGKDIGVEEAARYRSSIEGTGQEPPAAPAFARNPESLAKPGESRPGSPETAEFPAKLQGPRAPRALPTMPAAEQEAAGAAEPQDLAGWTFEGEPAPVAGTPKPHRPTTFGADFAGNTTLPRGPKAASTMPEKPADEKPKYDFSSTQTNLPEHVAEPMRQFAQSIPDEQLNAEEGGGFGGESSGDGREMEPHITVKYGLHDESPAAVQEILKNEPPITATLGKASLFSSDDADVLKVDIDSPDLHRLNAKIAQALPNTDTHPTYKPHATIAYLKPGEGKKYDGKDIPGVTGQKVTLDSVTFSGKSGDKVDIPLKGSATAAPGANLPANYETKEAAEAVHGKLSWTFQPAKHGPDVLARHGARWLGAKEGGLGLPIVIAPANPAADKIRAGVKPATAPANESQTKVVATFPGEENTEAVVGEFNGRFSVAVRDKDSGDWADEARVFKTKKEAIDYAKTIAVKQPEEPAAPSLAGSAGLSIEDIVGPIAAGLQQKSAPKSKPYNPDRDLRKMDRDLHARATAKLASRPKAPFGITDPLPTTIKAMNPEALSQGDRETLHDFLGTPEPERITHREDMSTSPAAKIKAGTRTPKPAARKIQEGTAKKANPFSGKADEARDYLKKLMGGEQLSAGVDPKALQALVYIGAEHIYDGATKFRDWMKRFMGQVGAAVRKIAGDAGITPHQAVREIHSMAAEANRRVGVEVEATPAVEEIERIMEEEPLHGAPESQTRSSEPERSRPLEEVSSEDGGEPGSERRTVRDAEGEDRPDAGSGDRPDSQRSRTEPGEADEQGSRVPSRRKRQPKRVVSTSGDYRITPADQLGQGGIKEKARNNLEAIRIVKAIEAEGGRIATPEEQAKLVKYVGWGSLSGAFDAWKSEWDGFREDLKTLLTPEEFEGARASTKNAHYTSPEVVAGMWRAVEHLGFKEPEGSVLEPAVGTGNFFGMIPESLRGTKRTGIELDPITGAIAKLLYPSANVQITGFQKAHLADNYFDLAISNVPFGKYGVHDAKYKRTPIATRSIHNYFFARALDKVRPGGIVAFVTSSFTMDEKSSATRDYLAGRADFLGAIRLPGGKKGAFAQNAGTEVTTDIIFLQKRGAQTAPAGEKWADQAEVDGEDEGDKPAKIPVNEYYAKHPEMMLGTMALKGTQYGPEKSKVLLGELTAEKINTAIAKLPKGVYQEYHDDSPAFESNPIHELPNPGEIKDGGYALKDGQVIIRKGQSYSTADVPADQAKRITGLMEVRDAIREVFRTQLKGDDPESISGARAALNRTYDKYVKKFGPVSSRENFKAYYGDPDAPLVLSLEDYDRETNTAKKRDVFTKRTIERYTPPERAEKASEALAIALAETGRVDWMRMQDLTGRTPEDMREELGDLIFQNPDGRTWETADGYLSGDVRAKLAIAENAAATDPDYERNVQALKAAQPKDLTPQQINARLGASWIPAADVKAFIAHLLLADVKSDWQRNDLEKQIHVGFAGPLGTWSVRLDDDARKLATNTDKWGHGTFGAYDLIEKALNLQYPKVFIDVPTLTADGKESSKRVIDKKATLAAQDKQDKIKAEFKKWLWADQNRGERLAQKYNDEFNNLRLREYDGKHLTFPGMAKLGLRNQDLDAHQKAAIWRMIQSGNTLLAHVVGAGKTFEMIAGAMEMKRMGLIKKPMIVVPNHLVEQWGADFLRLYPGANIFVAGKEHFSTGNRQQAMSRIATGNYDAVIVAHRSFEFLPVSDETFNGFMQEQLHEINAALAEAEAAARDEESHVSSSRRRKKPRKSPTIKQLESAKARIEKQIEDRSNREDKDETIHFEDLGVDQIFVDEAHMFKNLYYATKMTRVAGLPNSNSNRAMDMFIKTQYLTRLQNGKRGVVFATGTPISNTMAEMFTMQRYLQMDHLKATGLQSFDAWAQNFGEAETGLELAPEGTGYRMNTRFSKFINLPELLTAFRTVADVKTADDLNLPRPSLKTGKPIIISVEGSPELREKVKELGDRAADIRSGKVKPDEDNMLAIVGEGRKAALDMRIIDPSLPDNPSSKVNVAVEKIADIWQDSKANHSTQLVFLDMGTPRARKDNAKPEDASAAPEGQETSVYQDIKTKLIKRGVPAKEIRFIHDAKDDDAKQRLFDDVNAGRVRVLLGSTEKMGAGTNVQRKLIALHHIDVPWRPSDVEQRDGRGLRQGNENKEIQIIRYVTEDSFDGYMWQTILSKAKTISQAMSGDLSVREVEDVGLMQMSAAECMAASSGNPEVRERIGVEMEVRKLAALEEAHEDAKRRVQWELRNLPTTIKRDKATRSDYEKTKKQRDGFEGEAWDVADVDLTKPSERNRGLLQLAQSMMGEKGNLTIGSYKGFPIVAVGHGVHERKYKENGEEHVEYSPNAPSIEVGGYDARHWVARPKETEEGTTNAGLSLANDIRSTIDTDPDRQIRELTQSIDQNEARYRDLQSELNAPFEHGERLKKLQSRLEELNQKLNIGHSDNAGLADDDADTTPVADLLTPESKIEAGMKKPLFGSERGSLSLKPLTGSRLKRALDIEPEESSSSKEGPGLWINPSGQSVMLHGDGGPIATHGTTAMSMTGKKTAPAATDELLKQGYVRIRSNSIEFAKSAGPRAILSAVKTAKEHADQVGQTFIMVRGHVPQPMNAVVGLNEIGRFASNPVGYLTKQGQRGSVPAQALTAPVAKLAEGIEAIKQYGDDILKLLAPAAREGAEPAAMSVRHRAAELARESARAEAALEAASKILLKLPEDERWEFYDRVETGQPEPDRKLEIIARIMRTLLDKSRADVQALGNGKLESFIENYLPHYYKDEKKAKKLFADYFAKKPLEGSKGFLKRRKYETLADGMAAGLMPISDDPVDLVLLKVREMQKYVMAHQVLKDLKKQGILKFVKATSKMPEGYSRIDDRIATVFGPPFIDIKIPGRPLSRHTGHPVEMRIPGTPNPDVPSVMMGKGNVEAGPLPYVETTVTKRVPVFGTRIMGYYAAPEPAARLVNNYLSPGLREKSGLFRGFLSMGNAMNQFQLGYSAFHLGFTSMDAATSGLALGIYQAAHAVTDKRPGDLIAAASNIAKSPLELLGAVTGGLALGAEKIGIKGAVKVVAPFSTMLRGDRVLKEYYREGSQGGDLSTVVDAMLLAGGRAQMDKFYQNETSKKMMQAFHAIRSAPGIGKLGKAYSALWRVPFAITEQLSRPIMEYIVPRQKMGVFADMARYEMKRLKDASPEEVQSALARAWDSVDNRMGQLVYDNLFWHKVFKDALMASVRSVGWNTGTIRELLGGAADVRKVLKMQKTGDGWEWKPDVTPRLSYIIALPFMAAFVGSILQYLYTGEHPRDLKDRFFPRTGRLDKNGQPERVTSPSYIKDVVHYALEPVRTAKNKIHPLLTTIWEMLENRDYRNKPIRNADDPIVEQFMEEAEFAIKAYMPMAVSGAKQERERGASLGQQIPPFVGITPAPAVINRQPKAPKAMPLRMSRPMNMKSLLPKAKR